MCGFIERSIKFSLSDFFLPFMGKRANMGRAIVSRVCISYGPITKADNGGVKSRFQATKMVIHSTWSLARLAAINPRV